MREILHEKMNRFAASSLLASATLALSLLFGETLLHEEAYVELGYAELGYAVALLSILGSAACAGYLAFFVFRIHDGDLNLSPLLPVFSRETASDDGPGAGEDWPLLVTLLFGGISILFAGLAGWVEARA